MLVKHEVLVILQVLVEKMLRVAAMVLLKLLLLARDHY